ncbi:MAG: aminotransferase class III-fold pyridoxal phosphate-dependent enzyme [Lachnospiraceae bacterium]|nr:aminotransferase class III-fold pyridoxal phosphate-dependent enzyme [Lachnospiraceae bacterium]
MSKSLELYNRAKKVIPGGTQLLSKRPEMWLPNQWPSYYSRAKGCEVWDLDGNHYYDFCIMGVGANVLGYAFEEVDNAAKNAIDNGSMCTLNAPEEVLLAEKLIQLHPWAESVRYAKAGGEAMAMASRIARAHTKRDIVLVCGYHGWHDWYLSANLVKGDPLADVHLQGLSPVGVPRGLAGTNLIFHYNNINEFKSLVEENKGEIAAVIMEPIRNDYPIPGYLEKIRKITKEEGIVLIFDEITSGFRLCAGGAHKVLGVNPDMAVFAKGMTNGYPVTAVIGIKEVMDASQDTFISSTFWTERIGFAGALKSIECYEKYDVCKRQIEVGTKVSEGWKNLGEKYGLKIHINGILPLIHFAFQYDNPLAYKTYFTQEMLKEGFLAGPGVYASLAHTDEIIDMYFEACDRTFAKVSDMINNGKNIVEYLDGPVCHAGFERLN